MFRNALFLLAFATAMSAPTSAQETARPTLIVTQDKLDVLQGDEFVPQAWTLSAETQPDEFTVPVDEGEQMRFCFLSQGASFCRMVGRDSSVDLDIVKDGVVHWTRITGTRPAATFDAAYREAHAGKISVAVPEVYEMVSVALALTPTAQAQQCMLYKQGAYFAEINERFAGLRDHPFVKRLDAALAARIGDYFPLKMSGYSFVFDETGQIVESPIYGSTNFTGQPNALLGDLELMRSFARDSNFRSFYREHLPLYAGQVAYFENAIGAQRMADWLRVEFPSAQAYDHVQVVFSPLANCMQSVTWIETPGFRELQPHMNFPYPGTSSTFSAEADTLMRGALLFTEMNHGFINPTADRYAERISAALADRGLWVEAGKPADSYRNPYSLFNEYMNWALIDLWFMDRAPPAELAAMMENTRTQMVARGFRRFPEFQAFLAGLYAARQPGVPLERLYPQIVGWFESEAKAAS